MPLLEAINLKKHFKNIHAVNGINLQLEAGKCLGLLGPNGAGKTTSIEMLEGILQPSSGKILYKNKPIGKDFKTEAGIMFQSTALQEFITVRETITLFAHLYPKTLTLDEIVEYCDLGDFLNQDSRKLSGGQRQRLLLALALINDPVVLFLDEPTTGLDPQARRNLWSLIDSIKQQNKAILLTTHYMDEAYQLCDEIAIMDHGKIIAQDSPSNLLSNHFTESIIQIPKDCCPPDMQLDARIIHANSHTEILTTDVEKTINQLQALSISLAHIKIREHTLDDLFIEITGKEATPE